MKYIGITVFLYIVIASVSCGKKTDPMPFQDQETNITRPVVTKHFFRGDRFIVDFKIAENNKGEGFKHSIALFRLRVYSADTICMACRMTPFLTLEVDPSGRQTRLSGNLSLKGDDAFEFKQEKENFRFILKPELVDLISRKINVYALLDYITPERRRSASSGQIRFIKPIEIPAPVISVSARAVQDSGKTLIFMEWEQRQETVLQIVHDEQVMEKTVFYGINLYLIQEKDSFGLTAPLNDFPLSGGSYSIEVERGNLYACHVDRFGNESERVLIYKP